MGEVKGPGVEQGRRSNALPVHRREEADARTGAVVVGNQRAEGPAAP